jgi:hypothetical protein
MRGHGGGGVGGEADVGVDEQQVAAARRLGQPGAGMTLPVQPGGKAGAWTSRTRASRPAKPWTMAAVLSVLPSSITTTSTSQPVEARAARRQPAMLAASLRAGSGSRPGCRRAVRRAAAACATG